MISNAIFTTCSCFCVIFAFTAFDSAEYKKAAAAAPETDFSYSPSSEQVASAAKYANKAVYILNRTSAEGADNSAEHFYLTAHEKEDLEKICNAFAPKPVIVVLNTGYAMSCDFAFVDVKGIYADALLTAPYPGISGVKALCDILVGDVTPSGKTADTYARKITDYPSCENFSQNQLYANYEEDIYVGYRYYDTAGVASMYPFGFGMSYTSFEYSSLRIDDTGVRFTVENITFDFNMAVQQAMKRQGVKENLPKAKA